jgi:hypothetical protein
MPDRSVVQNDTSGSDKLVGPAAQNLKLSTGVSKIGGFVKPTVVTHENLVGAADEDASMAFCHLARLCFSKGKRTVGSGPPIALEDALDRFFVHSWWLHINLKASRGEQVFPG